MRVHGCGAHARVAAAYRTPQGREDGVYADLRSEDLSTRLIDHTLAETGLTGDHVDDLLWGVAQQRGEQDNNVARVIALLSELGESTPAATINRWCASSMQAVISAADAVAAGNRDCILAGGVEHMSRVPTDGDAYRHLHPELSDRYDVSRLRMGATAETVAEEYDVSRAAQDEYAARSHRRAASATESGRFDDEIVPVETPDGIVETDEGIRPDATVEARLKLPPAFASDGTVTAGNASQISDGGAIALGHPLGASGARLPVTLVHEMNERDVDRGLATLCVGFGQGAAVELRR